MVDTTAESGGAGGAFPAPEAAPVVADSVVPPPASDPAEVVGKRSAWEPEPSQLSDSVSDGARVRRRAPYWHRDDAPADTRVDGFAGWDDLPRGFMSAVFELLHEQTNAHRLLMTCGLVCKSWHRDAAETLLMDTAASGRGARRFANVGGATNGLNEDAFLGDRTGNREGDCGGGFRADVSDAEASLRARRESGETMTVSLNEEEFSSKRRRVDDFFGAGEKASGEGSRGNLAGDGDGGLLGGRPFSTRDESSVEGRARMRASPSRNVSSRSRLGTDASDRADASAR